MKKKTFSIVFVLLLMASAMVLVGYVMTLQPSDSLPTTPGQSSVQQEAACKSAMRDQFRAAVANGTEGSRPPQCDGLSDEVLQRLAYEVLDEEMAR